MSSLTYWSCVRFLVYLLAAETAMVFFQPRRDGFAFRLVSGLSLIHISLMAGTGVDFQHGRTTAGRERM